MSSATRRRSSSHGSPQGPRSRSQEPGTLKEEIFLTALETEDSKSDLGDDPERVATYRGGISRAMSEPCDGGREHDEENGSSGEIHADMASRTTGPRPTIPRFPVAETRNQNCWSEPSIDIFRVRGENYLYDKKKIQSDPYLLRARGCDLFNSDHPPISIGMNPSILGGALRKIPTFIVSFRFPWGVLVLYFEIPKKFCPFLYPGAEERPPSMQGMTPAEVSLARFFMADEDQKNSSLKLIPYVAEGPWIVRNMVTGKPAIIGNKLPVTYKYEPAQNGMAEYLGADLDIGSSSQTAKRIVSVCRRYMNLLTFDIGFVIQGNLEDELPEQMLGSVRVHRIDPVKAPSI